MYMSKNFKKEIVRMKKKYETLDFEIIRVDNADIITSSQGTETPVIPDNSDPFKGSYDSNGWT